MSKKRPTNAQEAAKNAKKTPKNEKCANIVPTYSSFGLDSGSAVPPLKHAKQYVKASKKCSGV